MPLPAPAAPQKLLCLEVARFVAAFCVVLAHLSASAFIFHLGRPVVSAPANAAVLFFFTLSGFVIHNAHARDSGNVKLLPRYAWRRFMRIFPLYWLSLVPILIYIGIGALRAWPLGYTAALFSLSPFTDFSFQEYNPPAWTLRCELLFYIIYGLALLPLLRRVLLPVWAALLATAWGLTLAGHGGPGCVAPFLPHGLALHLLTFNNIFFFAGLLAAEATARLRPGVSWLWALLAVAIITLLALGLVSWGRLDAPDGSVMIATAKLPFIAAGFAALLFALAGLERSGTLHLPRQAALLGAMSYPLYILQAEVWFLAYLYFTSHPAALSLYTPRSMLCLLLAGALLASYLAAILFDMPLQRLARRIA